MKAGSTFLLSAVDKHLWIVLSDPDRDSEHILLVNLTTFDDRKEPVCILDRGSHPWITHRTCVNYADSRVCSLADLLTLKDKGLLMLQDPMPADLLKRIRDSAMDSERMPLDNANVLIDQGLVDY